MNTYQVIVGNVGVVAEVTNQHVARKEFSAWIKLSKKGYGRASGEPVILIKNEEVQDEYDPACQESAKVEEAYLRYINTLNKAKVKLELALRQNLPELLQIAKDSLKKKKVV